jgi:ABC-type multidrug transport system fused ATPase/permease subunit
MSRFGRSWRLAQSSWAVIRDNRALLRFPLISSVTSTILGLIALVILWSVGLIDTGTDGEISIPGLIGLFILYLVTYTVVIFCNVALVSEVMAIFSGRPAGSTSGWEVARSEIRNIVGYAAIAATVGVILSLISGKGGRAGEIAAALGSAAWSLATFLVVPVLVVEQVGPADALKRSASLLRRTWGEQIIGNAGIGIVSGLATVIVVALGAGLVWLAWLTSVTALVVLAVIVAVIAIAIVLVITSALGSVYGAAVYRYATDQTAEGFEAIDLLPNAFRVK